MTVDFEHIIVAVVAIGGQEKVIISVSDASGQEAFHAIDLFIWSGWFQTAAFIAILITCWL